MIPYAMDRADKEEQGMGEREPRRCHRMVPERSLMVFSGRGNPELSARVAEKLDIELGHVDIKTFADGEIYSMEGSATDCEPIYAEGVGDYETLFETTSNEFQWLPQTVSLRAFGGKKTRLKFFEIST